MDEPDAEGDFPTNGDRFAAYELTKRADAQGYTRKGFLMQVIAAGWHHKSADQLKKLREKIGGNRILVIHGRLDRMITFPHGEVLAKELGGEEEGVTFIAVDDKSHALQWEWRHGLTKAVAAMVEKTEALSKK